MIFIESPLKFMKKSGELIEKLKTVPSSHLIDESPFHSDSNKIRKITI
jgi:hypothetical protein